MTELIATGTAEFSPDGVYRWWLTRELGGVRPLVICGLNPSIANAVKPDPTITKECGFARRWSCGRLVKVNANGFIATKPKAMKLAAKSGVDVVGSENNMYIRRAICEALAHNGIFLAGWGANIDRARQADLAEMLELLDPIGGPMCLGTNLDGSPEHPLYVPYERPLTRWRCP